MSSSSSSKHSTLHLVSQCAAAKSLTQKPSTAALGLQLIFIAALCYLGSNSEIAVLQAVVPGQLVR